MVWSAWKPPQSPNDPPYREFYYSRNHPICVFDYLLLPFWGTIIFPFFPRFRPRIFLSPENTRKPFRRSSLLRGGKKSLAGVVRGRVGVTEEYG